MVVRVAYAGQSEMLFNEEDPQGGRRIRRLASRASAAGNAMHRRPSRVAAVVEMAQQAGLSPRQLPPRQQELQQQRQQQQLKERPAAVAVVATEA